MTAERWTAPASLEVEREHARRVARSLRAEAGLFAQRRDEERSDSGSDEQRDERGRLYSVVAEGRRFYYVAQLADTLDAVSAELAAASVERDSLREHVAALQEQDERNLAELVAVYAVVDSLRGVVQAARAKLAEPNKWRPYESHDLGEAFLADIVLDWRDHVLAVLAAAADAPQPQDAPPTCRVRWPWPTIAEQPADPPMCEHGETGPHRIPSPWHDDPSEHRVYHCPGPSPAVLPQPSEDQR